MADGWIVTAAPVVPWRIVVEANGMACPCVELPVVTGFDGQVRDLTVEWSAACRALDEDRVTSVVWASAPVAASASSVVANVPPVVGFETTARVTVGLTPTLVSAVATLGSGQTIRQSVIVRAVP
jgi:hypothetical protein